MILLNLYLCGCFENLFLCYGPYQLAWCVSKSKTTVLWFTETPQGFLSCSTKVGIHSSGLFCGNFTQSCFRTNWTIYLNYEDVYTVISEPEFRDLIFPTRQSDKKMCLWKWTGFVCIKRPFLKFLSSFSNCAFTIFFRKSLVCSPIHLCFARSFLTSLSADYLLWKSLRNCEGKGS